MKKIPDPGKFSVSPLYKRASVKLMHMGQCPVFVGYIPMPAGRAGSFKSMGF